MLEKKIYIYGAGGHAKVVAATARLLGYSVAGFIDDFSPERAGEVFDGAKVMTYYDLLNAKGEEILVALGFGNCVARNETGKRLLADRFSLETLIHPQASVASNAEIGKGVFVGANSVIDPCVKIGDYVIVNDLACICHDSVVEVGAHICPGTLLAGNVNIGFCSWIGLGSRVIENIKIGAKTFIGAGSVVIRDIPDESLAYGIPAIVKGKNK